MGFIDDELQEVSKLCENVIKDSRLVSCVPAMVRTEITHTTFKKIIVCIQFPSDYPQVPLLIELKSKTLSSKLLLKLTEVCEKECKSLIGKAQILPTLKLIQNFIEDNPLICCYDEISLIKKLMNERDSFKLKQKSSSIHLEIYQDNYFYKSKIIVPHDYPLTSVSINDVETNFPPIFSRYFIGQAHELGRRCVEPPLKKQLNQIFSPSPSLNCVISFLIRAIKTLPNEKCQWCKKSCLPENPAEAILDENANLHVERLYCSHLFHLECLLKYMKTPPFHGGKKCPTCGQRVYHDKWAVSDKLAEDRWAHEQARARELAEVADFFE
ncbi:uncharacterized protein LOC130678718 isoform X1 [Microplitis mediator]|uniref:uncharacterized protein LOC130678718 isoform X1 n=1 Tax=Microplitis mediator TaxID=375433 RepID=UPI002553EA63|nr:uncharacterized protein LOC130678718 isoform X1 [Microplitis mediator]